MKPHDLAIRLLKKSFRTVGRKAFLNPACNMSRVEANRAIYELLISGRPCMVSRFGTTELNCINNYLCVASSEPYVKRLWQYITDNTHTPWWNTDHFYYMSVYSGIFPPTAETARRFSQRYLQDVPEIDILGSFQYYEKFMPLSPSVERFHLETLYPFFVDKPWTSALKGRRVLVVHPFDTSIGAQYGRRSLLFSNPEVLPDFKLITYRAVQSVAGSKVAFSDWFEALSYMERQISEIDFDVAIIGCGAYGLPLAAHIKRLGKAAIHLGGGTQLLFGIKGKRWTEQYAAEEEYRPGVFINTNYRDIFNDDWIFPDESEKPQNSAAVENSCYW